VENKKLPDNRSWIEEDDYIAIFSSGNTNGETQNHWAHRRMREEQTIKIINIDENELYEFIDICKATFGTFQIQIDEKRKHYFVVSIMLRQSPVDHEQDSDYVNGSVNSK